MISNETIIVTCGSELHADKVSIYLRPTLAWGLHTDGELVWPSARSPIRVFLAMHPCTLGDNQAIGQKQLLF